MIFEEGLRHAAEASVLDLAYSLPEPEAIQHDFSHDFEKKMQKVIRRGKHPQLYRSLRSAASFLLALLFSGSLWLAVDTEARQVVFGWIRERVEGAYHYFIHGAGIGPETGVRYTFSKIPEGYQEEEIFETDGHTEITYVDGATGRYLSLGWISPSAETATQELFFLTDDIEPETVQVNGQAADFYQDKGDNMGNTLVWRNEERDMLLYVSGYIDKEHLIKLAQTVKIEEIEIF